MVEARTCPGVNTATAKRCRSATQVDPVRAEPVIVQHRRVDRRDRRFGEPPAGEEGEHGAGILHQKAALPALSAQRVLHRHAVHAVAEVGVFELMDVAELGEGVGVSRSSAAPSGISTPGELQRASHVASRQRVEVHRARTRLR